MAGVVIALQAACDSGAVAEQRLEQLAAAAQLRVRRVAAAAADLLVCQASKTLAFLLWPAAADGAARGGVDARVARLAASFKQAFVVVPHALLGDAAVLDAAARYAAAEPPVSFVFMPMGADFAERALALAAAVLAGDAEEAAWRQQQAQTVQSLEAVTPVLLSLPLPGERDDGGHHANMLRMLGSLQQLSRRQGDQIAALTDIGPADADAIAAFFRRGRAAPRGGPAMGAALQSL